MGTRDGSANGSRGEWSESLRQREERRRWISCKQGDLVEALTKEFFESRGGTVAKRKADDVGRCSAEEAEVVKIFVL